MSKQKKFKAPKEKPKKEFGSGTLTKAGFFQGIRSALRQKSRWWPPISEAKKDARRDYKGPNKRQKFEYLCAACGGYFSDKECKVDHKIECGQLSSFEDIGQFAKRLFCEKEDLQVLCDECHNTKTAEYKRQIKEEKENEIG